MSQCTRILAILADGLPHTIEEIHERAGTMRLNSRVAELRTRGHDIVCTRDGDTYRYRLVSLGQEPAEADSSPSEAEHILDPPPGEPPASLKTSGESHGADWGRTGDSPEQLTLEELAA